MTQVSVREAETRLASLIRAAREGEDIVITDGDEPIARIVSVPGGSKVRSPRRAGSGKGKFIMSPDFDAPVEDFPANNSESLHSASELKSTQTTKSQLRPFGLCAGQFTVPDDFDAPLPDDVIADFEGE